MSASHQTTRILGVDTSIRGTGVGVVERQGNHYRALAYDTLTCPAAWPHSRCLVRIQDGLREIIAATSPDAVAIEGIFHCRNVKTAMILGQARGAAIAVCAGAGLPVFEYAPRKVKQSVCGSGAADKTQIARMVVKLLNLKVDPLADEADALALAICHFHASTTIAALAPDPI